jgi:hypothetical protein
MSLDVMKQALDALEGWANHGKWVWPESALEQAKRNTTESIAALRERLAQPEQEPVAKAWDEGYRQGVQDERISEANIGIAGFGAKVEPARQNPYGTTPPQRKPEQEPVAWVCPSWLNPDTRKWESESFAPEPIKGWIPLYTAPRQWQGLTEAEKVNVAIDCGCADGAWMDFADAIEAKLKEKNT